MQEKFLKATGVVFMLTGLLSTVKLHPIGLSVEWPATALILFGWLAVFFTNHLNDLIPRLRSFKVKDIELMLDTLPLSAAVRQQLSGLGGNEMWALDSFSKKEITVMVDQMKPAQRLTARILVDLKLMKVVGEGPAAQVVVTSLGEEVLKAAKSLPLLEEKTIQAAK